jgi:hypothetical protein
MSDDLYLDAHDIDALRSIGWHIVGDARSEALRHERRDSLIAAVAQIEALKRRERRREEARQIRLVKAAQKAGLQVMRAVIDGIAVELGQPEAIPATPPLDEIETPEQLRRLI